MSAANADFELFRVFLEKTCGIVLGSNKQYLVSSRLNKLMEQQGIKSLGELVQRIQTQRGGLREMVVDAMTTNETLWFRDTYPFEVLKQRVLPELIKANGGQRLRIWRRPVRQARSHTRCRWPSTSSRRPTWGS